MTSKLPEKSEETESLESLLTKHIPEPDLAEVRRILYGKPVE